MKSVAFGKYIIAPGAVVRVPVSDWGEAAQAAERAGRVRILNPGHQSVYSVVNCSPRAKQAPPSGPTPDSSAPRRKRGKRTLPES